MDDREQKAKQIARQMNTREKSLQKSIPTKEQARLIVQQKKELEKQKQDSSSKVVHLTSSKETPPKKPTIKSNTPPIKKPASPKHTPPTKKAASTKTAKTTKKPATPKKKPLPTKKKSVPTSAKRVRKSHIDAKKKSESKKSFLTKGHLIIFIAIMLVTIITSTVGISLLKMRKEKSVDSQPSMFTTIHIEEGMNTSQIASLLEENNIISNKNTFVEYIKDEGNEKKLLSGVYNFTKESSHEEINQILTQKVVSPIVTITIYKGSVVKEIDERLSRLQLIQSGEFIEALEKERVKRNLSFTEGWVFSDEYVVQRGDNVASTLALAVIDRLYEVLKVELEEAGELDYSLNEIIIIASMIQRETQEVDQMPLIAGVMYNRLERDEPLGIDATTRYALDAWDRELVQKDFAASGKYDTRRRVGLPPTGIGSVGIDAIRAALHPADHDYLFYFHDKEGAVHLSYTYKEHKERFDEL